MCADLNASFNKIKKYTFVKSSEFKQALLEYKLPIITGLYLPDDFNEYDTFINYGSNKISKTRGHCVVVYGWNEIGYLAKNWWEDMHYLEIPFGYNQFSDSWIILE